MKPTFSLVAVIFLLWSHSFALSCKESNPFVSHLVKLGVTVYEEPQTPASSHCQPIWSTQGACCEPESLVNYANADSEQIDKNINQMSLEFKGFIKYIKRLQQVLLSIVALKKFDYAAYLGDKAAKRLKKLIYVVDKQLLHKQVFHTFQKHVHFARTFREENQKCWAKMSKLRNSALCSTCSGRSHQYFLNQKANMAEDTCQAVIDDCWKSFKFLNQYFTRMRYIARLKKLPKRFGKDLIIMEDKGIVYLDRISKINRKFRQNNIFMLINTYDLSAANPSATQQIINRVLTRTLCRRFIKIQGKTIIRRLDEVISGGHMVVHLGKLAKFLIKKQRKTLGKEAYQELLEGRSTKSSIKANQIGENIMSREIEELKLEDERYTKMIQDGITRRQNMYKQKENAPAVRRLFLRGSSRYLDEVDSWQGTDDTTGEELNILAGGDSMWTSFDGNKGTSLAFENGCTVRAMNLSVCFP